MFVIGGERMEDKLHTRTVWNWFFQNQKFESLRILWHWIKWHKISFVFLHLSEFFVHFFFSTELNRTFELIVRINFNVHIIDGSFVIFDNILAVKWIEIIVGTNNLAEFNYGTVVNYTLSVEKIKLNHLITALLFFSICINIDYESG